MTALLCFQTLLWDVWADSRLLGVAGAALTLQTTSVCGTVCKLALWTQGCSLAGRSHRQSDQIHCCERIHHQGNSSGYRYKQTLDYKFKNKGEKAFLQEFYVIYFVRRPAGMINSCIFWLFFLLFWIIRNGALLEQVNCAWLNKQLNKHNSVWI